MEVSGDVPDLQPPFDQVKHDHQPQEDLVSGTSEVDTGVQVGEKDVGDVISSLVHPIRRVEREGTPPASPVSETHPLGPSPLKGFRHPEKVWSPSWLVYRPDYPGESPDLSKIFSLFL